MKFRTMSIRRFTLLAVPCAALLLYVVATARRVHANVPGTNGQITYTRGVLDFNGGPGANIFTADFDGSNVQQLPLPDGIALELFSGSIWSPDGTKLLISHTLRNDSTGQFFTQPATVSPDGSNFNQLMPPNPPGDSSVGMNCSAWTRDQTRILCGLPTGIFSLRASDGGDPVRLTTSPPGTIGDNPTDASPDGMRFVFLRYRQMNFPETTQQVAMFVANIDGTGGIRQITPYGLVHAHEFTGASWSPDGLNIISQTTGGPSQTTGGRLFTVQPDGKGLTPIPLQIGTGNYFAFGPKWSPDGTRIIFCMFINGGEGIYTANPDGSNVRQVTFTTDFTNVYVGPDWGTHPLQ